MKKHLKQDWLLYLIFSVVAIVIAKEFATNDLPAAPILSTVDEPDYWVAPSLYVDNITKGDQRKMVIYGQDLIANTAIYLGPNGSVKQISNGMNCQNCHLDAGSRPWGNNYGAVASTYPKFRERSGSVENIAKRVNDCLERSLNGEVLDTSSHEMKAIITYIQWLGANVKKGEKPKGAGIVEVPFLDRAASPAKGQIVYNEKCMSCHAANGEGVENIAGNGYTYPPLWGKNAYNNGAGLYRLSRFAGYVKVNMPFNQATYKNPVLTDEEAWDVAAFVNSQPRPQKDLSTDWSNISAKPFDHPYGPFTEGFSEAQHKYGPFKPIIAKKKDLKKSAETVAKNSIKK